MKNTQLDNLVANLRAEVGEVITTWVVVRRLMAQERDLSSQDIAKDMTDQDLVFVSVLVNKLGDELVARLSELAEPKIGRLTFHFAAVKLGELNDEVKAFGSFISRNKFDEKRNCDISHKELPERWSQHKHLHIPYRTVLRGVAYASRLMKKIDRIALGPAAKYLWQEMRKKRYSLVNPAGAAYMLLPYLNLSNEVRAKVIMEEMAEGRQVWSPMSTTINGQQATVPACQTWGAILLGDRIIVLDHYPLQQLSQINMNPTDPGPTGIRVKSIYEHKEITAKYQVAKASNGKLLLVPIRRQHPLDNGAVTDLVDIGINLDDKLSQDMREMKVGDVKELSLTVTVLSGYEVAPD